MPYTSSSEMATFSARLGAPRQEKKIFLPLMFIDVPLNSREFAISERLKSDLERLMLQEQ